MAKFVALLTRMGGAFLPGKGVRRFANEVDAVNQYAPVMYAPTANGTAGFRRRETPQMMLSSPNVATNSLKELRSTRADVLRYPVTSKRVSRNPQLAVNY